jgi:thiamine-monophosphate kinase
MKISDIGGEFGMLRRLTRRDLTNPNLVLGVGDDCAILQYSPSLYLLVTTDMMVENDHFSLHWQTPYQIGMKLMEVNVSDIVCKGGRPKFAFLSICLKKDTTVEFVDGFYHGLYESAQKHGVLLVGGDTTHGAQLVFNLALTGEVEPDLVRLRSGARVGDIICVTGTLGGSTAGLELLRHKLDGYVQDHLEPKSRSVADGIAIARFANATIDVSDGLGNEVTHIARESNTGACILYDEIPYSETTIASAKKLERDPADFALYGGEDFQIVFTIDKNKLILLEKEFTDFTIVGEILAREQGIYLLQGNRKLPLKKGYDHFA